MTVKFLIDDSLYLSSGNKVETYLEIPEFIPTEVTHNSPEVLALELNYSPATAEGYRLVSEEIMPDGTRQIHQEFVFSVDMAYALFKLLESFESKSE